MGAWISCDKKLPESHRPVLVFTLLKTVAVCYRGLDDEYDDWGWFYAGIPRVCGGPCEVTHWMYLPASPDGDIKEGK